LKRAECRANRLFFAVLRMQYLMFSYVPHVAPNGSRGCAFFKGRFSYLALIS
jgi:hypothetical protein